MILQDSKEFITPTGKMNFPVIDIPATGTNINRLRKEKGYSAQQVADFMGFAFPGAVYKWERGETLPSVDNLYALSRLLEVPIDEILVER